MDIIGSHVDLTSWLRGHQDREWAATSRIAARSINNAQISPSDTPCDTCFDALNRIECHSMKLLLGGILFASVAAQLATGQSALFGNNLIVNGGAESGAGGDGVTRVTNVPGWQASGGCDVYAYQTAFRKVNAVSPTDIVPRGAGDNYFAGGQAAASCTFVQNPAIDLSAGASTIDAGKATYALSGYLGGYGADHDNATLMVSFQNASGAAIKTYTIGPVTATDRLDSGLYLRRQIGQVPVGARKAAITLNMNWVDGATNEAAADNLGLILNAPAPAQSLLGMNLISNPGADASPGLLNSSPVTISTDLPGWVRSAYLTADSYQDSDSNGDLYQLTSGIPPDAGSNYFYGGKDVSDNSNPVATAYQDIDVSSAASLIDAGNLPFALSGWLGGYAGQDDNCVVAVQFQQWDGTVLGSATIGPVLAADRNDVTMLLQRSTSGMAPTGTRVMHVFMTVTREVGTNNDGLADSLSLVLGSNGNVGPEVSDSIISAGAFGAFDAVTQGTWMEIYGANLAKDTRVWAGSDFNGVNGPTSLDGTTVTVAGLPAVTYYISPTQVNALVPGGVAAGPQPVVVSTADGPSVPFMVSVDPAEPGFLAPPSFVVNGNQYVVAQFSDGTFVLPQGAIAGITSRPAKPGDTIIIYGIGFGAVTPAVPIGQITEVSNTLSAPFQFYFGSTLAKTTYSGLAPGQIGVYQFNVVVPAIIDGDFTPISISLGGVTGTQTLYTAVRN